MASFSRTGVRDEQGESGLFFASFWNLPSSVPFPGTLHSGTAAVPGDGLTDTSTHFSAPHFEGSVSLPCCFHFLCSWHSSFLSGRLLLESRFYLFIDMYSFPIYVYESRYIFNIYEFLEFLLDCFFPLLPLLSPWLEARVLSALCLLLPLEEETGFEVSEYCVAPEERQWFFIPSTVFLL